jgi:hypothetical protein
LEKVDRLGPSGVDSSCGIDNCGGEFCSPEICDEASGDRVIGSLSHRFPKWLNDSLAQ